MKNEIHIVRIIPPQREEGGFTPAQGTQVFVGDLEVGHVQKIVMTAEPGALWQAVITCHPNIGIFEGISAVFEKPKPSWWRRALVKLAGAVIDDTSLRDSAKSYRKPDEDYRRKGSNPDAPGPCPPPPKGPPPPPDYARNH